MHIHFDSLNEFAEHCCTLLQAADRHGLACTDWLEIAQGKHGHDRHIADWLAALPRWSGPQAVVDAFVTQGEECLAIGQAHHALLADVALALVEGLFGEALLTRLSPHFPGIELLSLAAEVAAAEAAYQAASDDHLCRLIESLGDNGGDSDEDTPCPSVPIHLIEPGASAQTRAAALIWQLDRRIKNRPIPGEHPLAVWQVDKQPGPIARFAEEYCRFETPPDLPRLIGLQRQAADRALRLKLQLLQATLRGILHRQLRGTAAELAAHFDGDLPGTPQARWLKEPEAADPGQALRLIAAEGADQWRIACDGTEIILAESECRALAVALEHILDQEPSNCQPTMQAAFDLIIKRLTDLDDRTFQRFLRETQSTTLELMLSALPLQSPYPEKAHPFHAKVGRNLSRVAWELMQVDVARRGSAPLDAFELMQVLGELVATDRTLKLKLAAGSNLQRWPEFDLALPDIRINGRLALCGRKPRGLTVVVGDVEPVLWRIGVAELRHFAAQLAERRVLRQFGAPDFARAWLARWLEWRCQESAVRHRRFLRSLTMAEIGQLLQAASPNVRSPWLAACSTVAREVLAIEIERATASDWKLVTNRFLAHEAFRRR